MIKLIAVFGWVVPALYSSGVCGIVRRRRYPIAREQVR